MTNNINYNNNKNKYDLTVLFSAPKDTVKRYTEVIKRINNKIKKKLKQYETVKLFPTVNACL